MTLAIFEEKLLLSIGQEMDAAVIRGNQSICEDLGQIHAVTSALDSVMIDQQTLKGTVEELGALVNNVSRVVSALKMSPNSSSSELPSLLTSFRSMQAKMDENNTFTRNKLLAVIELVKHSLQVNPFSFILSLLLILG